MDRRSILAGSTAIIAVMTTIAVTAVIGGWLEPDLTAPPDCEAIGSGPIGQPVTALSASVLWAAGLWTMATARRLTVHLIGTSLAIAGIGAFLFHAAPSDATARLDALGVALVTAALAVAAWNRGPSLAIGLTAMSIGVSLIAPWALEPIALVFGVVAAIGAVRTGASRWLLTGAIGVLAGGWVLWYAGRRNGPLCDPDSIFQAHALWHVAAASAVVLAVIALRTADAPSDRLYSVE